jgi:hypothetical protein
MPPVHLRPCPVEGHPGVAASSASIALGVRPSSLAFFFSRSDRCPLDVDGRSVMEQTLKDGSRQDLVVKDLAPVREAACCWSR